MKALIVNLKIGTRLGVAFAAMLALMLLLAAVGLHGMQRADGHMSEIVNDNVKKMQLSQEMSDSVHIVSRVLRTIILLDDKAEQETEYAKIVAARARYDKAWDALARMPASEAGKAIRLQIDAAKVEARATNNKVLELARANQDEQASRMLLQEAGPKVAAWQAALDVNIELQARSTQADYEAAHAADRQAQFLLAGITLVAIVLTVVAAMTLTRSITRPLATAVQAAGRIRDGDLTQPIETSGRDETAQLLAAMRDMQSSLVSVVGKVRGNADSVATASAQIAQGNADLSQRTEQQASSLQQTAATMEQLGATVKLNAENAQQANQLARSASDVAVKGGTVVGEVVGTMKGISDSSKRIAEIIGTIDGIAFQTNILALNAAVEAARAGEQGRGFAVVAGEVRSLAQRSAEAAREIKRLISDSVERVGQGTELVDQAGKTMGEVVDSIKRVSDIVAEISAASVEQSSGIGQVGDAVSQMDQVTQQNAALVEQSAAAAESLKQQATALVQAVGTFKLNVGPSVGPSTAGVASTQTAKSWSGAERRGADRARNVVRPDFTPRKIETTKVEPVSASAPATVAAKTGTDDDWTTF